MGIPGKVTDRNWQAELETFLLTQGAPQKRSRQDADDAGSDLELDGQQPAGKCTRQRLLQVAAAERIALRGPAIAGTVHTALQMILSVRQTAAMFSKGATVCRKAAAHVSNDCCQHFPSTFCCDPA